MIQPGSAWHQMVMPGPTPKPSRAEDVQPVRNPPAECTTPLGWPEEPEVYRMNSGSDAPCTAPGRLGGVGCAAMASCHQTSPGRESSMGRPVRRTRSLRGTSWGWTRETGRPAL